MKNSLGDEARLRHIYDAIAEIESYVKDITLDEFQTNTMMQRACVNLLEIIGEASSHLTERFKKEFDQIEWREIVSLRNILIHEYFGTDTKIVWDIIQKDIPFLKQQIQIILK